MSSGAGIALPAIQAWSVRGDARHEDVTRQPVAGVARRRHDIDRRRAFSPVVGQIEDYFRTLLSQHLGNGPEVAAVRLQVADVRSKIVAIAPVQHGDVVPALHQALDNMGGR